MKSFALAAALALACAPRAEANSVDYPAIPVDTTPKGWLNASTFAPSFGTSGWIGCYLDYPLGSSVVANPVWGKPDGKNTAACPAGTYTYNGVADTPAPCWAKTQPNAFSPTPAVTSTFQGVQVPHFLDFSSILQKNTHNQVFRVPVRPGACLPGNMVNVRTSAASFPALAAAPTNYASSAFMDAKMNVYTTTADDITNGMLTQYTPRSPKNTISIYFALNYGLRNAIDNPYDSTGSNPRAVNGGYYVSNLTTALLGDVSKNLGRAYTAEIKLCFAPMSIVDRPWRKKGGDAIKNKQCLQLISRFQPANAVTGLAVNDAPLPGLLNSGVPAVSPVAFCRPGLNASAPSGMSPLKTAGAQFNAATNVSTPASAPNNDPNYASSVSAGAQDSNCVRSGQSWKVTKGDNVDLTDPDWYQVNYTFPVETPKATYFVRVLVRDVYGNYLGFGSSATSANLTNSNAQNFFKVDGWSAVKSTGTTDSSIYDLRAGAIGCSLMTVVCGALFFGWDAYKSRQEDRLATSVVEDTSAVDKPAPQ